MKKRKNATRIIAIVLVLLMALALIPFAASAQTGVVWTFEGNGGRTSDDKTTYTLAAAEDGSLTLTNNFLWDDHTFIGWYRTDTNVTVHNFSAGQKLDNPLTNGNARAQWTVSVNFAGGTPAPSGSKAAVTHNVPGNFDSEGHELSGNFTVPDAEGFTAAAGYVFKEWAGSDGVTYHPGNTIERLSENLTLTARWEMADPVTISFDANGGSGGPAAITTPRAVQVSVPETQPAQDGFAFLGWSENPSASAAQYTAGSPINNPASGTTLTLYAVWASDNITFRFHGNGAAGTMDSATASRSSGKYILPTASTFTTPLGKILAGWTIGGTNYALGGEYTINNNTPGEVDVTARWTDMHKVIFDANGGSPATTEVLVPDGGTVPAASFPSVTKDGYSLLGWYDGTAAFTSETPVNASRTVTATWLNNTVAVTFSSGDGSGAAQTQNMSRTAAGNLRAFSGLDFTPPQGKVFQGWALTPNGSKQFDDGESVTWNGSAGEKNYAEAPANPGNPGTVTLYALWQDKLAGSVAFSKGGEAVVSGTTTFKAGDTVTATAAVTVPSPAPSPLYYRWMIADADSGSTVASGQVAGTSASYEIRAADLGKALQVFFSTDETFSPGNIINGGFAVTPDSSEQVTLTVTLAGAAGNSSVTVNGELVNAAAPTKAIRVTKGADVTVAIAADSTQKVKSVMKGSAPQSLDTTSYTWQFTADASVTVTFEAKSKGTTPTAVVNISGTVPAAAQSAIQAKAGTNPCCIYDVVACWDGVVSNPVSPADIPAAGLNFLLPYPAGSGKVPSTGKDISSAMNTYYRVRVWHWNGSTLEQIPASRVAPGASLNSRISVTGQKDFSPIAADLTPIPLSGTLKINGLVTDSASSTAAAGTSLTAAFTTNGAAVAGKLTYHWQYKDGSEWKDLATGTSFTPSLTYRGRDLRCMVTSDFETEPESGWPAKIFKVIEKPNPLVVQVVVRGHNPVDGRVGNVSSDMEWTGPSASTPSSTAVWHSISGAATTFPAAAGGKYWVRFKNDTTSSNWAPVTVPVYYTVTGLPGDSVSVNRVYFSAAAATGSGVITRVENKEWLVPEGKSINVTANSANTKYYKLVRLAKENVDTGVVNAKNVNRANSASTGNITVNDPYVIYAWAGVYGAKTGDTSHLNLWIELAVLSLMGLSAAVVFGRKKLKKQ